MRKATSTASVFQADGADEREFPMAHRTSKIAVAVSGVAGRDWMVSERSGLG